VTNKQTNGHESKKPLYTSGTKPALLYFIHFITKTNITMKKYLIISIFLFLACKKEKEVTVSVPCNKPTNDIALSRLLILGKWEWVSELTASRVTGFKLKTPQTEGYTEQLKVYSDKLEFYKDNVFRSRYKYDFVIESTLTKFDGDSVNVLVFKNYDTGIREGHTYFRICKDSLALHYQRSSSLGGLVKWKKTN
jgi:hypothetical protein